MFTMYKYIIHTYIQIRESNETKADLLKPSVLDRLLEILRALLGNPKCTRSLVVYIYIYIFHLLHFYLFIYLFVYLFIYLFISRPKPHLWHVWL